MYKKEVKLNETEFELDTDGVEEEVGEYLSNELEDDLKADGYGLSDFTFTQDGEVVFSLETEIGYTENDGESYVSFYVEYPSGGAVDIPEKVMKTNAVYDWVLDMVLDAYRATQD